MSASIIIGSRGSDLALWQAHFVRDQLTQLGYSVQIEIIKTQGDRIQHLSFDKLEGKGFFTKELEEALLEGRIDLAVHSHKDLPTTAPDGLQVAGVSYREDCSESLLIRNDCYDPLLPLHVKYGATVGTSSLRRKSQLQHLRPDLHIIDLRGNVPTRVQKLKEGNYDAVMLASAGLNRLALDLQGMHREVLSPRQFIPAPAQGVLAYQIRENDTRIEEAIRAIHHPDIAHQIYAERKVLNQLDGGCQLPLGVYCEPHRDKFRAWASLLPLDGSPFRTVFAESFNPETLAGKLLDALRRKGNRSVYISRDADEAPQFISMVTATGDRVIAHNPVAYETVEVPVIPYADWIFFSSIRTVSHFFEQDLAIPANVRIAALGSGTAAALRQRGFEPEFVGADGATRDTAEAFLPLARQTEVLFPVAENSLRSIQKGIEAHCRVHDVVVYRSEPAVLPATIDADIYVFTSPGTVEAFVDQLGLPQGPVVSIGKTTSEALRKAGIPYCHQAPFTNEVSLAQMVNGLP